MRSIARFIPLIVLLTTLPLAAVPPEDVKPIDQAVGDLDRLSVSQRIVEWGQNDIGGQDSTLIEVTDPRAEPWSDRPWLFEKPMDAHFRKVYYRIGGGYRARLVQPDYLIPIDKKKRQFYRNVTPLKDRVFEELIPADTVFELTALPAFVPSSRPLTDPPRARPDAQLPGSDDPAPAPGAVRIDGSVAGHVDGRIDGRVID